MILQENTLFANRYQLMHLLGHGGFSEVWLAKDSYTNLYIAIKVYAPGRGMDSHGLQEFSQELAGVFNLNHINLLKPTHVDVWDSMPYLIMPYCSLGSISKHICKMQENEIWKLMHDVAAGLAYLHQNDIIHQDIKPDNILIDDAGNYVITDFGISTKIRSTLCGSVVTSKVSGGTMAYMGPERFSRQPAPTKASDIWSFGAMLYELITGNVPFGEIGGAMQKAGAEIPDISVTVSDELKGLIGEMLSYETWDRPNAETIMNRSRQMNTIKRPVENLSAKIEIGLPFSPKHRNKKWIILSIVLLVLTVGGWGIYNYVQWEQLFETFQKKVDIEELQIKKDTIPDNFVLVEGGILSQYLEYVGSQKVPKDIPLDSFYISKYELTQKEFETMHMPDNPSPFVGDSLPLMGLTYAEALIYCNLLSNFYGYDGFYIIKDDSVAFRSSGNGFRLPTQYEWAYAARDRQESAYKYASGNNLKEIAWYGMTSNGKPHKVGTKAPNKLGLFDMTGNAGELVWLDNQKNINFPHIWGEYSLYNFASHCFQEDNVSTGEWHYDNVGMRLVLIPRSIKTNDNIKVSTERKIVNVFMTQWKYYDSPSPVLAYIPYNIGRIYEYGFGIKRDATEAERWYHIAADNGHIKAKAKLGQDTINVKL